MYFKIPIETIIADAGQKASDYDIEDITASSVFLTVLANHVLHEKSEFVPLGSLEIMNFVDTAFKQDEKTNTYSLKKDISNEATTWIFSRLSFDDGQKACLERFLFSCFDMLEEEFSTLAEKKSIDAKYISGIILKKNETEINTQ